ncbi:MAG: phosphoribosylanthranilate isomerase [Clostridium sp.]|uniref:phosphoribosylanthranilate isomerase n=1 Tax=Clostridium sp. TaxID=1506 RepID=UPI003F2FE799
MKVKICGITLEDEISFLNKLEVDYLGFVFCESKRRISIEDGRKLCRKVRKGESVGVFRNNSIEFIEKVYKETGIEWIQLHGNEDIEFIEMLKERIKIKKIIKALSIDDVHKIEEFNEYKIIIDGRSPGSGEAFDYSLLNKINREFILAGGISKERLKDIPRDKNIRGLDLSTGVEKIVGNMRVKDEKKVREFLKELKGE